jgi:hypothetical protein
LKEKELRDIAQGVSTKQLNLLRVHIDSVFRKENKLHPSVLYARLKDLVDIEQDEFRKQLTACVKTKRIAGYRIGRGGTLYRDELQENLKKKKEEARRQAPPAPKLPKDEPIKFEPPSTKRSETKPNPTYKGPEPEKIKVIVDGDEYAVPMKSSDIELLLTRVLKAKKNETGRIEFDGKKYECDADLFGRFIFFFFGASLRIQGDQPQ